MIFCKCGCGQVIKEGNKYIYGHNSRRQNRPWKGIPRTQEVKNKISKTMKGISKTEETKRKISESRKGIIFTDEHKKRLSEAHKGKYPSEETKKKMLGRFVSEETRRKISEANIGKTRSNEFKIRLSEINTGKILSEETKRKISEAQNGRIGENASNWKGGISYLPYCSKFNNKLKEQIRKRDNRVCQLCHIPEKNKQRLSVHHIHYDKENCYPDLISLCNKCNSKVNGNREYWEKYFMEILERKNLLNYFGDSG